jgi:AcrR family transcriptional regulator
MGRTTKKDAILEAALTLFAEKGVDATTTREIAEKAQTSEGNLYRHFEGKDDIVRTLFRLSARRFAEVLDESAGDQRTPGRPPRRPGPGRVHLRGKSSRRVLVPSRLPPHGHAPGPGPAPRPVPMRLFVETIVRGVSRGVFRPIDPVLATGWIVAMAQRAALLVRMGFLADDRARIIDETVAAAMRVLARDDGMSGSGK